MNVIGERVLIFGDSLSHPGPDKGPSIVDITVLGLVSSAPGELIARQLLAAGAQAVRVNAKVGRSARSFFSVENGTGLLARDQSEFQPTKVIVWLGTNDINLGLTPNALASTAAAMTKIRDAYRAMGAEVFALGPPTYPNATFNNAAPAMFETIRNVFGADHTFDIRPFTTSAPRAGDGIHFTASGAAAVAPGIAQMLAAPVAVVLAPSGMSTGTKIALGVLGVAGFVGLSWFALRVAKRAARGSGTLGAVDEKLIQRMAQMLSYDVPKKEIRDRFVDEGYSDEDVYLAYKAAQMYLKQQDELLPHEQQLGAFGAIVQSSWDSTTQTQKSVPTTAKRKARKILARYLEREWSEAIDDDADADKLTEREKAAIADQLYRQVDRINKLLGPIPPNWL